MKKLEEKLPPDLLLVRRNNAKITKLKITEEQLTAVDRSPNKRNAIREILGVHVCICGKIPFYECQTQVGDFDQPITKKEFFCKDCITKVFVRAREEKEIGLEELYNFKKVDSLPPSEASP